jgi:hypothetical protein
MKYTFTNFDLNLEKTFLRTGDQAKIVVKPKINQHALARDIYFQPSYCPLISIHDSNKGSCFQELDIPSASFQVTVQNNQVVMMQSVKKTLVVDDYVCKLYDNIRNTIANIYDRHAIVNLCYSGGIDSLVLLSFVLELGLIGRTRLINFENHTQTHDTCLHVNQDQKLKVKTLLENMQSQSLGIEYHTFDLDHIANVFNAHGLAELKCYATQSLLEKYHDQVFLLGYHGNQIFVHKNIFFDELVIQQPSWKHRLESYISSRHDYYTASARDFKVSKESIPIERRHLLAKPWSKLDGYQGNKIYSPIGSDANFQMTRSLDFSKIHPDVIMDAQIARSLISMNSRVNLLEYIGIESTKDNDNLEEIRIPAHLIDQKQLVIPENLIHDSEGVSYLRDEIMSMPQRGWLAINSAVAIKSLQHISAHYK